MLSTELKTDGSERTVPISDELAEKLLQHLTQKGARFDQDALIFTTEIGAAIRQSNFNRREWMPLVEALGHDKMTVHDLRHTFATHSADAGVPVHPCYDSRALTSNGSELLHTRTSDTNRAGIERLTAHRAR